MTVMILILRVMVIIIVIINNSNSKNHGINKKLSRKIMILLKFSIISKLFIIKRNSGTLFHNEREMYGSEFFPVVVLRNGVLNFYEKCFLGQFWYQQITSFR